MGRKEEGKKGRREESFGRARKKEFGRGGGGKDGNEDKYSNYDKIFIFQSHSFTLLRSRSRVKEVGEGEEEDEK